MLCHIVHISDFVRTALKMDLPAELFGQRTSRHARHLQKKMYVRGLCIPSMSELTFRAVTILQYRFQIPRTYPHLLHPLCHICPYHEQCQCKPETVQGVVSCNATHPFARRNRTVLQHRTKRACFGFLFRHSEHLKREIIFQIKQRAFVRDFQYYLLHLYDLTYSIICRKPRQRHHILQLSGLKRYSGTSGRGISYRQPYNNTYFCLSTPFSQFRHFCCISTASFCAVCFLVPSIRALCQVWARIVACKGGSAQPPRQAGHSNPVERVARAFLLKRKAG